MELDLIKGEDVDELPSRSVIPLMSSQFLQLSCRRKLNVRGAAVTDPIVIHPDLMNALEHYVAARVDDVACLVAKFLNTFLNDSPFLQSYEVDNFVLRNGIMLTQWWVPLSPSRLSIVLKSAVHGNFMIFNDTKYLP